VAPFFTAISITPTSSVTVVLSTSRTGRRSQRTLRSPAHGRSPTPTQWQPCLIASTGRSLLLNDIRYGPSSDGPGQQFKRAAPGQVPAFFRSSISARRRPGWKRTQITGSRQTEPGAKNARPIPKKAAGYHLTSHETVQRWIVRSKEHVL
jgi:hypothetical protein